MYRRSLCSRMQARCAQCAVSDPRHVHLSAQAAAVPGLSLITEFVTEAEERALLEGLADAPWACLARRQVCHYGFAFDYLVRLSQVLSSAVVHRESTLS